MNSTRAFCSALLIALVAALAGCDRNSSVVYDPDATLSAPSVQEPVVETADVQTESGTVVESQGNATLIFDATNTRLEIDSSERPFVGFLTAEDKDRARSLKVVRGSGRITQSGLLAFTLCRDLKEFLWNDAVVDRDAQTSFMVLAGLTRLNKVRLTGLQTEDGVFPQETISALSQIPHLVELDLSGSKITAKDFQGIRSWSDRFPALKRLNFYGSTLGDAGVRAIASLAFRLESLNVDDAQITNDSAEALKLFTNLTFLHVGRSELEDSGLDKLTVLTRLEKIHVTRSRVTEEGAERFRKALPNCEVVSQPEN